LVTQGCLDARDRVELLEGVIVAEPPMDPPHASAITLVAKALQGVIRDRALVRVQAPFIAGPFSVPEPDVAVVPGAASDYYRAHPSTALLVVEASASSLPQDRLSKSRIYAGAAVPEYWIVNLRDQCVEIFRTPDHAKRGYAHRSTARCGERIVPVAFPDAGIAVRELLPDTPDA
jgi:Uma2 family endonuclease